MIRVSRLLELAGERLVFDTSGNPVDIDLPAGPAVLVLAPVSDALKRMSDGLVAGSVDRDDVARVVAFAVDRAVLAAVDRDDLGAADLIGAVRASGVSWTTHTGG